MNIGNHVYKPKGYPYPGIIVGKFKTLAGKTRYCVESTELPGMLHIFNAEQLEFSEDQANPINLPIDKLEMLFEAQRQLELGYGHDFVEMDNATRIQVIKDTVLALTDELHEALAEVRWKPWASNPDNQVYTKSNRAAFQGELVDALHFFITLCLLADMDADALYSGYLAKNARNQQRQASGYDAVSDKCTVCHVDKQDLLAAGYDPYTAMNCASDFHRWPCQ